MSSTTNPISAPPGWKSGISSLAFDLDEDESDPDDESQDAAGTSGGRLGNKAQEKTFERSLMQELDLESRHDPARPPPNLLTAPNRNKKRKPAPPGKHTSKNDLPVPPASVSTSGRPWQMSLPFMPLPKGSRDGPVGTTGKEKNPAGAGEAGSSDLRSGSSEGTKKRKTLVLGPNHNTTGTRKTSIQQKISSFGVPRPEPSRRDPLISSNSKERKEESKHYGTREGVQGEAGTEAKKDVGGGGIRFGTLPNLKIPAAQRYPIVMGFEKQKTLPVKPPAAGLANRSIGLAVEPQVRYPESRARSEDEIVYLGESSFTELGNKEAEVDRPSGSQKLQRFKLDAGRLEAIPLTADGERNAVDLRAEEDLDEDIPLEDQADDYGFREDVPDPRDFMGGTLDNAGIYQEDQGLEVDQHQPSPYLSMQHAPVYVQKSSPNVSHTSGHFVRDLEPEDFYGSQTSYTKSSFARPSNKNKRLSTSTIAHPATPSRTLAHHHQVLQEVPSDRSAVPVDIIARRAFQAARAKGNDQEDYRGEGLADDTDELASTWSTLPSRQTIKTKPKVPVKTAAKFSLPNGLFGKNRQPNPTLFSGPSHIPARAKTYKHPAPTRSDPDQADPARKVTLFHPTPRPDISIGTASSPTPSPLVKPRLLHRSYTEKAALAKSSSDERPLTTPLTSVLLQPTYLDPLEPSRICVDLRDLARDYRSYRLAIGASHRVYTPPPLVSQTSQEHPARCPPWMDASLVS